MGVEVEVETLPIGDVLWVAQSLRTAGLRCDWRGMQWRKGGERLLVTSSWLPLPIAHGRPDMGAGVLACHGGPEVGALGAEV